MVSLAAACAVVLAALVSTTAVATGKGLIAALLLLVVGGVAALVALATTDAAPWSARHWTAWLQPRPLAAALVAIFVGFGVMSDALALLEPRPAVESRPRAIEDDVKQILTAVAPRPAPPPRIRLKLPGTWGEPGCAVTYRLNIRDEAVIMDSERRPAGEAPWHSVATIIDVDGDVIEARTERPARGTGVTLTYITNGVVERLRWHDHDRPVAVELDRCE